MHFLLIFAIVAGIIVLIIGSFRVMNEDDPDTGFVLIMAAVLVIFVCSTMLGFQIHNEAFAQGVASVHPTTQPLEKP